VLAVRCAHDGIAEGICIRYLKCCDTAAEAFLVHSHAFLEPLLKSICARFGCFVWLLVSSVRNPSLQHQQQEFVDFSQRNLQQHLFFVVLLFMWPLVAFF
jgi:hypothetical protein